MLEPEGIRVYFREGMAEVIYPRMRYQQLMPAGKRVLETVEILLR